MPGHILFVGHDDRVRDAICLLLNRAGKTVRSTTTSEGALKELRYVPAIMVLDLALPDGNGIEVLRFAQSLRLPMAVAVIAGVMDDPSFRALKVLGTDAIFGNPFDFQDFVDWLSQSFGGDQTSNCDEQLIDEARAKIRRKSPLKNNDHGSRRLRPTSAVYV